MFVSIIKAAKIVNVDPLQDDKIYPEARYVININDVNNLRMCPFDCCVCDHLLINVHFSIH